METKVNNNYAVLIPSGRVDSSNASDFEREILGVIDSGSKNVILDFSKIEYISSAGLRVLLVTSKKIGVLGGKFAIAAMNENIFKVFESSGFSKVLTIVSDVQSAEKEMS